VTDGVQSYALFTYKCGEMEWSGGATIGFGASDELYANLRLSGSSQANAVACLNSPTTEWSNLLYKLTDDPGTTRSCAHKLLTQHACVTLFYSFAAMYICVLCAQYSLLTHHYKLEECQAVHNTLPSSHTRCSPVTVRFAQAVYVISEAAPSQNLALSVCVIASTNERSFSVTLSPLPGTADGKNLAVMLPLHIFICVSYNHMEFEYTT